MQQTDLRQRPYLNKNLFSGHYLDERIQNREEWQCDEDAQEVMSELQSLYEIEGDLLEGYDEDPLIDNWIDEVLDILGFGTQTEVTLPDGDGHVDELLFEDPNARRDAARLYLDTDKTRDLFEGGISLVEAKQLGTDFSKRFSDERQYRNASDQVIFYLEKTPANLQWGVLTDGRKWRLYYLQSLGGTQTYYEVDLLELLEEGDIEKFKYFYTFFRPAAFRESRGGTFLDSVREESEVAAQELGEDLQNNVFTALRILGRGFVETNNLDIEPDNSEELETLKEQSLVLLYRLMFVLYAESRGLIQPEDVGAADEYNENFSLNSLRLDIHDNIGETGTDFAEKFSEHSTTMWSRIDDLFQLIDQGQESMGIPPYNGGLFDPSEHKFLSDHEVADKYLSEVIYWLTTVENEDGRFVLADYSDLDTRHLGSVYEGLLEHQFRIAPERYAAVEEDSTQVWKPATEVTDYEVVETVPKDGLYVANDDGERKASGAYYTPDHVVKYIVSERIDPLIEGIRTDLIDQGFERGTNEYLGPFLSQVKNLKILDPAMGSGHFLTSATNYLTDRVMDEVRETDEEMALSFNESHVRREIAKECIYGVDVNEMAVELAKLSMWLETLAADRPLAFLDHRLKTGDSILGSDITEVLSNGENGGEGQLTLFEAFARVREQTLDYVMDRMQELLEIDNETLEDIKSMEDIYNNIRSDPLYQRLFELCNVHTAEGLGVNIPDGSYERMAGAIENDEEWNNIQTEDWFLSAQQLAREHEFFHWELEFPEVFFNVDGELRENPGFDAGIGNPPYGDILPDAQKQYCRNVGRGFDSERADIFTAFVSRANEVVKQDRYLGYILPNTFLRGEQYSSFRQTNSEEFKVESIVDFNETYVFDVEFYTAIGLFQKSESPDSYTASYINGEDHEQDGVPVKFEIEPGTDNTWIPENPIASKIRHAENTRELNDEICTCHDAGIDYKVSGQGWQDRGEGTSVSDLILYEGEKEHEDDIQYIGGSEITPFDISPEKKWLRHDYESFIEGDITIQVYPDYNEVEEKIVTRQTAHRQDSIIAAVDTTQLYTAKSVHTSILRDENYDARYIASILNSRVIDYVYDAASGEQGQTFGQVRLHELRGLPIPEIDFEGESFSEEQYKSLEQQYEQSIQSNRADITVPDCDNSVVIHSFLSYLANSLQELKEAYKDVNTDIEDYLGSYSEGPKLGELEGCQTVEGVKEKPMTSTTNDYKKLKISSVEIVDADDDLILHTTLRYKPENPEEHETDSNNYISTESLPTIKFTDLTPLQKQLIREFVPHVVDVKDKSSGYYSEAKKTITPIDRIKDIALPQPDEVADRLQDYQNNKNQALELERKILLTDEYMNQLIYRLYDLTYEDIKEIEEEVLVDLRNKIIKGETT
jgi:type I restriction-modification system DNA methylase subunit